MDKIVIERHFKWGRPAATKYCVSIETESGELISILGSFLTRDGADRLASENGVRLGLPVFVRTLGGKLLDTKDTNRIS